MHLSQTVDGHTATAWVTAHQLSRAPVLQTHTDTHTNAHTLPVQLSSLATPTTHREMHSTALHLNTSYTCIYIVKSQFMGCSFRSTVLMSLKCTDMNV